MPYYIVDWRGRGEESESLAELDFHPATLVPWTCGVPWAERMAKTVPNPIEFVLDKDQGTKIPDAFLVGIPLFSARMIDVLEQAGVDNLDKHNAVIVDPRTNARYETHKAVNIIGAVECADLAKSDYDPDFKPPFMEFHKLVVDEARARGLLFFRLAEAPDFILAHDVVARALIAAKLSGLRVVPAA